MSRAVAAKPVEAGDASSSSFCPPPQLALRGQSLVVPQRPENNGDQPVQVDPNAQTSLPPVLVPGTRSATDAAPCSAISERLHSNNDSRAA